MEIEVEATDEAGSTRVAEPAHFPLNGAPLTQERMDKEIAERVRFHVEQADREKDALSWLATYGEPVVRVMGGRSAPPGNPGQAR